MRVFMTSLLALGFAMAYAGEIVLDDLEFARHDENNDGYLDAGEWEQLGHEVAFEDADLDGDGRVSLGEARAVRIRADDEWDLRVQDDAALGAGEQQADTGLSELAFDDLDRDGDGEISREEARQAPVLVEQFEQWDTNNDGALQAAEFDRALADFEPYQAGEDGEMTEQVIDEEIRIRDFEFWDRDGDGLIDRVEFEQGLESLNENDDPENDPGSNPR